MKGLRKREDNIKILFAGRFAESEILSGPERFASSLFYHISAKQSVTFIQYFFDGREHSIFRKLFGRQEKTIGTGKIITLGLLRVLPFLALYRPDVIHLLQFERFGVLLYIYRVFFNVKIVYNCHGVVQHENSVIKNITGYLKFKDNFCEKVFMKYSDVIVFPSIAARAKAEEYYKTGRSKTAILPNFAGEEFSAAGHTSLSTGRLKAVIQHRNHFTQSGMDLLFESAGNVKSPMDVYIVTDIDIRLPGKGNAAFHKIPLMKAGMLAEFYRDKDVFLSLNSYDTFSIAAAEAMASGLIPVVTNETGIAAYINNKINGFKIDYGNNNALAETLDMIAGLDRTQIAQLSKAAADTAAEFSGEKAFNGYASIYKEPAR